MAIYVGSKPGLYGKRALVRKPSLKNGEHVLGDILMAQFNFDPPDMTENNDGGPLNYLCYGWHVFSEISFQIEDD